MNNNCTINDKWKYNGMRVVYMENEFLKIGILVDRGSDIFQFEFKPLGVDLMLRLDKDIINPAEMFSQQRDTKNQFEDYYYGGWQEILPNSPAINYRGASLGQHGEVSLVPWQYAIINQSADEVQVKLWTRPLRYPILIEKVLTLSRGSAALVIDETLTNESNTDLHLMWGHHIAFGLPFLAEGGKIETSGTKFYAEETMPSQRYFKSGQLQDWPMVERKDGKIIDASEILKNGAAKFSDLAYLSEFIDDAYYTIATDKMKFSLHWDKHIFKSLWYWQERYSTQDAPWWGNVYAMALEPWTAAFHPNPDASHMENNWLHLTPRESINTSLRANCEAV